MPAMLGEYTKDNCGVDVRLGEEEHRCDFNKQAQLKRHMAPVEKSDLIKKTLKAAKLQNAVVASPVADKDMIMSLNSFKHPHPS